MESISNVEQVRAAHQLAVNLCNQVPESAFSGVYHFLMNRLLGGGFSFPFSNMTATGAQVQSYLGCKSNDPDLVKDVRKAFEA